MQNQFLSQVCERGCERSTQFPMVVSGLYLQTTVNAWTSNTTTWSSDESCSCCSSLVAGDGRNSKPATPDDSYWSKKHRSKCYDVLSVFVNIPRNGSALWALANNPNVCIDRFVGTPRRGRKCIWHHTQRSNIKHSCCHPLRLQVKNP